MDIQILYSLIAVPYGLFGMAFVPWGIALLFGLVLWAVPLYD